MLNKITSILTTSRERIKQKDKSFKNMTIYDVRIETIEKSINRIDNKINDMEDTLLLMDNSVDIMCKCTHANCQFDTFLKGEEIYYFEDQLKDNYCIFHAPEEVKKNFTYYQNQLFKEIIETYFRQKQNIDFSSSIFHIPFEFNDFDLSGKTINFTDTVFIEYFRMDNLKCEALVFQDTEFHDGGGIKNRGIERGTQINKLIYKPYQLESDFVIDIGRYANTEGLVETNLYGVIQKIQFENHKIGNGIIYFIGLNHQLEEGNFRNRILDNVSFQNCNLSRCYFLNSKIDKAEFRNCEFKKEKDFLNSQFIGIIIAIISIVGIILKEEKIWEITDGSFVIMIFVFFLGCLYFLIPFANSHVVIFDEMKIKDKNKKTREKTWKSLSETYRMLKENLSRNDYQRGGDFFYSQRLTQLYYTEAKMDRLLYLLHYFINGFGERFMRPLLMFMFVILFFSFSYKPDKDFIGTDNTPRFLVIESTDTNLSNQSYYKKQIYIDINGHKKKRIYVPDTLDKSRPIDHFKICWIYSASQFISPLTNQNRAWFKTISSTGILLNYIETILLYIFFGAFILALKNRIKR